MELSSEGISVLGTVPSISWHPVKHKSMIDKKAGKICFIGSLTFNGAWSYRSMHHIFVLIQVNSIICISRFIFEADVFSVVGVPSIAMAHSVIERNHRDMTTRGQQNITCIAS